MVAIDSNAYMVKCRRSRAAKHLALSKHASAITSGDEHPLLLEAVCPSSDKQSVVHAAVDLV